MEHEAARHGASIQRLEDRRISVSGAIDRKQRSSLGQFFTPGTIARYMASLFDTSTRDIHLLDPGAGIGSLTAAVAHSFEHCRIRATCYEIEAGFEGELRETLAGLPNVAAKVQQRDFIEHAVMLSASGCAPGYSHVILNPPYKKIGNGSIHRALMRKLAVETTNLYACFLVCAITLCRPGAEVVAIVPRSFMNGVYFKSFRYWLLERVALTHIHVFESRSNAFSDDEVLQENVIMRVVVDARQGDVDVTTSRDQRFLDTRHRLCRFSEIVTSSDKEKFIHLPTHGSPNSDGLPGLTLRERGLDVCTGPVVDFRLREHIRALPGQDTVPLLYSSHFAGGYFEWPRAGRKPNAIVRNSHTEKWLMPNGCYVVLRRFSSKEEKRRVVAYLFDGDALAADVIGFENHLNVVHEDRHGLPPALARGLVAYLNSQEVDDYFRIFSGHTQVNATDLRRLRYPSTEELEALGRAAVAQEDQRCQTDTD